MTIVFSELQPKLSRFAEDSLQTDAVGAAQDRLFPLPLRIDGWNWAQKVFVQHTPRQRSVTLEIDTDGRSAVLPDDFFDVHGLYDSDNEEWWMPKVFQPGEYRALDDESLEYWVWGEKLILETDADHGTDDLTLYYWAYYPDIEYEIGEDDDGDEDPDDITYKQESIYTPRWADAALIHLCVAYCWQPGSIQANDINEWRINVDSGTPMHNPRQAGAWDHYTWYNELIAQVHPARG